MKKKAKTLWGTRMRNPRTDGLEEYVSVIAESIEELELFYNAMPYANRQPFQREKCNLCRVLKGKS